MWITSYNLPPQPELPSTTRQPQHLLVLRPGRCENRHQKPLEAYRTHAHYWDRWSKEYLHTLQNRNKWQQTKENIQKGQLVLLKENNLPPGKWAMGRVVELHPGSDNLVRVVTLKTQCGLLKRPITKLAPLAIHDAYKDAKPHMVNSKPEHCNNNQRKRGKRSHSLLRAANNLLLTLFLAFTTISCGLVMPLQHFKIMYSGIFTMFIIYPWSWRL